MDWLTFFSSIVASLAWPCCAVAIALIFRAKISHLLTKLLKVELPGGVTAEFDKSLDRVEDAVVPLPIAVQSTPLGTAGNETNIATNTSSDPAVEHPGGRSTPQNIEPPIRENPSIEAPSLPNFLMPGSPFFPHNDLTVSQDEIVHPAGVVMEAWKELELQIVRLAINSLEHRKISKFNMLNITDALKKLSDGQVITGEEAGILLEMRRLRNLAAHSDDPLSASEAKRFARQARQLSASLYSRRLD